MKRFENFLAAALAEKLDEPINNIIGVLYI